jgi:serine/threonine protein kinase
MNSELIVDIYRFLRKHTNFQAETGISIPINPKSLGSGTRGIAFDIGNGIALKITDDLSEAKVAEQLKDQNIRGLYKTFGSYKFTKKPTDEQKEVMRVHSIDSGIKETYFIIMEKLNKDDHRADMIGWGVGKIRNDLDGPAFNSNKKWTDEKLADFIGNKKLLKEIEEIDSKRLKDDIIELAYGLNNLKKLGIRYDDLHAGNILFNSKGKPVIIDIGFSSGGKGKPEVFEDCNI